MRSSGSVVGVGDEELLASGTVPSRWHQLTYRWHGWIGAGVPDRAICPITVASAHLSMAWLDRRRRPGSGHVSLVSSSILRSDQSCPGGLSSQDGVGDFGPRVAAMGAPGVSAAGDEAPPESCICLPTRGNIGYHHAGAIAMTHSRPQESCSRKCRLAMSGAVRA